MKIDFNTLIRLDLLNISSLAGKIYPDIPKNQAGAKLRNKINNVNGNRLTDADLKLIEDLIKA